MGRWDARESITENSFKIVKNENNPQRTYAEMIYDSGDKCDITGEQRSAKIQFRCAIQDKSTNMVSFREDPSCHYIVEIETPLLCKHNDFEIPKPPTHEIICYPYNDKELWIDNQNKNKIKPSNNDNLNEFNAHSMKAVVDEQIKEDNFLKLLRDASIIRRKQLGDVDAIEYNNNNIDKELENGLDELLPWLEAVGFDINGISNAVGGSNDGNNMVNTRESRESGENEKSDENVLNNNENVVDESVSD